MSDNKHYVNFEVRGAPLRVDGVKDFVFLLIDTLIVLSLFAIGAIVFPLYF